MAIIHLLIITLKPENGKKSIIKYKKTNETFKRREQEDIIVKLCENIVDHMAIVTVMYDKETYVRTKTSLRVSFTDKLAAFG